MKLNWREYDVVIAYFKVRRKLASWHWCHWSWDGLFQKIKRIIPFTAPAPLRTNEYVKIQVTLLVAVKAIAPKDKDDESLQMRQQEDTGAAAVAAFLDHQAEKTNSTKLKLVDYEVSSAKSWSLRRLRTANIPEHVPLWVELFGKD